MQISFPNTHAKEKDWTFSMSHWEGEHEESWESSGENSQEYLRYVR